MVTYLTTDIGNLLIKIMKVYLTISIIAIIYSFIRAKHDSFISGGSWKTWALIEAIFFSGLLAYFLGSNIIDYIFLPVIFGIWFSIFFDMFCGWIWAKKLFYFGSGVYDKAMKKVFITPLNFIVFKIVWLILISGAYSQIN